MATQIETTLTAWQLSPREQVEGSRLNIDQRRVIQNRLYLFAMEKLHWVYNPAQHLECIQRESELQGQIRLLELMLEESDEAERELVNLAREQ